MVCLWYVYFIQLLGIEKDMLVQSDRSKKNALTPRAHKNKIKTTSDSNACPCPTVANVLNEEQELVPPCLTKTSCPPLIRHANRKQRTPFFDVRNRAKLELTDEELIERFIAYNKDLGDQPNCIRKPSGKPKPLNYSCLSILNSSTMMTNLYQKAVAHFQLYFGELKKHEQQQKVMDWIQFGGTKSHRPFLLPFVTPPGTAIACLTEIEGHMICISALLSQLGAGSFWYNTCRTFFNKGTIPRHGL
jgi:hypothetical protein